MNQKNLWLRECSCIQHVLVIRWLVHEVTAQKVTRTHLNGFSLLTLHLNLLWNHSSNMPHTIYLTWLCHKIGTVCSMLTTVWKVNREDRLPLASCLNSSLFLLEKMALFSLPYHGRQPYPNTSLHKQQLKSQKTNCNLNSIRRTMSDYPSFHRSEQRIWKVGAFLDQRMALILFKLCKITGLFKNNEACFGKALTF